MTNNPNSRADAAPSSGENTGPLAAAYTLFVVVTNRDVFLKECIGSFRTCYPSIQIVLVDNSGDGRFRTLGKELGVEVQANDRILSVSENQNSILDRCRTKRFVFSADDIIFQRGGFLEEAVALHQKGFELVSLGVDDPCAFSMQAEKTPQIGRFNTGLKGKETTDLDIKKRCEGVYGHLPSVGGFWRETPAFWESKYIKHYRFKPDVNQFLKDQGMTDNQINNEKPAEGYFRLFSMARNRLAVLVGGWLMKYGNIFLRKGLQPPVFEARKRLTPLTWRNRRILSIGQVPRHYFWPYYLARFLGAPPVFEKVIIEKCEAFKPFLEEKFTAGQGFKIHADDVLNVDKILGAGTVDLAVWYDGPEHLEKERGMEAIKKLEQVTRGLVLIGTPQGFLHQGADDSFKKIQNPYNTHLSGWDVSELEKMGYQTHVCNESIPTIVAWKRTD